MKNKIYIYDPFTKLHKFIINNIKYELEEYFDIFIINHIEEIDCIIIIFINFHFIKDNLIKDDYSKLIENKYNILYITEPINFIVEKNIYNRIIREIHPILLLTYSFGNSNKLKIKQKLIKFYPINKNYFSFSKLNNLSNKDNEKVVFIGKINDNRSYIKDLFKDRLIIIDDKWTEHEWVNIIDKYLFFINIHRRKGCKCLETMRIYPLLYNGCVVFSENVNEKEMEIYKEYNISFCESKLLLESINNYNVDFDKIKNKTLKFRNRSNNCIDILLNELKYYNLFSK